MGKEQCKYYQELVQESTEKIAKDETAFTLTCPQCGLEYCVDHIVYLHVPRMVTTTYGFCDVEIEANPSVGYEEINIPDTHS